MAAYRFFISLCISTSLHFTPAFTAGPLLGKLYSGAVPVPDAAGFAPRFYLDSIPALPAEPVSPNPALVLDGRELAVTAADNCRPGFHSCAEANGDGLCCPNDRYCYLDGNWKTKCCSLGVTCPGSLCGPDEMYCNVTTTIFPTKTKTATEDHQDSMVTSMFSVTTLAACCNRACDASSYQCESFYGGQCCKNGARCGLTSVCIDNPTTSTPISTVVSEVPPGCTTSQFACSEGGGCCNIGSICTHQSSGTATSMPVCAPEPEESSGGGSSSSGGGSGLSNGAKAGVGVGVAVGALIIIGAVSWLCIRRRRLSGSTVANASSNQRQGNTGAVAEMVRGGRRGLRRDTYDSGGLTAWSEQTTVSPLPHLHDHGRAYSYSGPDAVTGPYTAQSPGPDAVLPYNGSTGQIQNFGEAPHSADHVMRPVEIGGTETPGGTKKVDIDKANGEMERQKSPPVGVFELMGNTGSSELRS